MKNKTIQELYEEFKLDENHGLKIGRDHQLDIQKSTFEHGLMEHFKELDFDTYSRLRIIELLKGQNELLDSISTKLHEE